MPSVGFSSQKLGKHYNIMTQKQYETGPQLLTNTKYTVTYGCSTDTEMMTLNSHYAQIRTLQRANITFSEPTVWELLKKAC